MKRYIIFPIIIAFAFISFSQLAQAQHRFENPRSIGMGGTGTSFIGDFNANFINPANLMLSDRSRSTVISFAGVGVGAGGPLADINSYNRFLTKGLLIDRALQDQMLDAWVGSSNDPAKTHYLGVQLGVIPIATSFQINNHAFSAAVRARAIGRVGVSRGLMELGLAGFDNEIFSEARAVNANSSFTGFSEISFGYATKVFETSNGPLWDAPMRVFAGVAPKVLIGVSTAKFNLNSDLMVSGDSLIVHNFEYSFSTFGELTDNIDRYISDRQQMSEFPNIDDYLEIGDDIFGVNATGIGFDIGVTAEIDLPNTFLVGSFFGNGKRYVRLALSLTDVGRMNFSNNTAMFRNQNQLRWTGLLIDQDRLRNEFDSNLGDYFSEVISDSIANNLYLDFARTNNGSLQPVLPAQMNFGMQLTVGRFTSALDLSKGLNYEGPNSKIVALGMGVEYLALNVIPLRAGFNTGGANAASWTVGTGLQTRHYDFNVGLMFVENSKGTGTWLAGGLSALTFRF